jgi:hypothetical protein
MKTKRSSLKILCFAIGISMFIASIISIVSMIVESSVPFVF